MRDVSLDPLSVTGICERRIVVFEVMLKMNRQATG